MSMALYGIGVGGGIAIGRARLVWHADIEIAHYVLRAQDVPSEVVRYQDALAQTRLELQKLRQQIPESSQAELAAFLDLHVMLLDDHTLSKDPIAIIEEEHCNAEWALKLQRDYLVEQFDDIADEYLRARGQDIMQVTSRIFKVLSGKHANPHINIVNSQQTILVAHDLSPADMVFFKDARFAGFMTDVGGSASHTAILARSLDIPSVLALSNARELIRDNEIVIVDGTQGVVIVNPDAKIIAEYTIKQKKWHEKTHRLHAILHQPARTIDGTDIEMMANIELPEDAAHALSNGAKGIGLFRSEFLYLSEEGLPSEEQQYLAYREVIENMQGMPVIIRTVDLGKDKIPKWAKTGFEAANPALGLTGIRLCLAEPLLFRVQLRALLRAAVHGPLKILLPMLSQCHEILQTKTFIAEAQADLKAANIAFAERIEIGGMIETPAAALCLEQYLPLLDFISIGTNDLIQYTLAVDRSDDAVSHLYNPLHPAIVKLLANIIQQADKHQKPVAICGEMAGDPQLTKLLLGLGLRRFSMLPTQLLKVKQQILNTSLPDLHQAIATILTHRDPEETRLILQELNHEAQ